MSDAYIAEFQNEADKIIAHLKSELIKIQTGRANPTLVEHIEVEVYGSMQIIRNVATISIPDPKTISIQPFDKSSLSNIENAIRKSDIGLSPVNNGALILLNIPPLTEDRRKEMVKIINKIGEESKVAVRQARQKVLDPIKSSEDSTDDDKKYYEKLIQEKVDKANEQIEELLKKKEEEVMTI